MVEEFGLDGSAAFMLAEASNARGMPYTELSRLEIAETRLEIGETPDSQKTVEAPISAQAEQMTVDLRLENPWNHEIAFGIEGEIKFTVS